MPKQYACLSEVTVGAGGASTINFASIPSTYTDLLLKISGRGTRADTGSNWLISFNSSTSNFSARYFEQVNNSTYTGTYARFIGPVPAANATASTFSNTSVYIPNYLSSRSKSYSVDSVIENNATLAPLTFVAGLWSDASAIASITISSGSSDNIAQYSTVSLYGITNS